MIPALLGTKVGMTQVLGEGGVVEPVTLIKAGPCVVLQVKTAETDGYEAVQLGFEDIKPHRSTQPLIGHAARARTGPKRYSREVRLDEPTDVTAGEVITVQRFTDDEVNLVDVTGVSKGKGFAGVMKRHHFGGLEASHGVERKHRSSGAIGGSATGGTGRGVKKGKRMAGHLGNVRRTVSGLRLVAVDADKDLLLIRGSVPGANGSLVFVRRAKKQKGAV